MSAAEAPKTEGSTGHPPNGNLTSMAYLVGFELMT